MTAQDLIDTEEEIRRLWEAGEINSLLHLEGSIDGSYEQWLCDFFHSNVKPTDWVLASHRCHFVWQLHHADGFGHFEGNIDKQPFGKFVHRTVHEELIDRILHGKSMFLYGKRFICSAIVAGTASIAVGLALSIQRRGGTERVWNFIGDGGSEHGHFLESVAFVHAKDLPCQFIICDNNSSCGVTKAERRGSDKELVWPPCVTKVSYQPRFPHAGNGTRPQLKRTCPNT